MATTDAATAAAASAICVFCGSSPGKTPIYLEAATALGQTLAENDRKLVYGGGERGCMGAVASAAIKAGGKVLGVIPRVMVTDKPRGHHGEDQQHLEPSKGAAGPSSGEGVGPRTLDAGNGASSNLQTIVVETMHERKRIMASSCSAFIGLPGGYGTFEEVMEMITWSQLGIHAKPVVLLNANGFYDPLRQMIDFAVQEGFINERGSRLVSLVGQKGDDAKTLAQKTLQEVERLTQAMATDKVGYWDWDKKASKQAAPADAVMAPPKPDSSELAVTVPNLTFSYGAGSPPALTDVNLTLKRGSRCLLIGANGSGKSTLLRLLAGKRLCDSSVRVFGRDVFRDAPRGITYLGTEWAMNPVVRGDIVVSHFLDSVGGYRHKERRDRLLNILDIDLDWHMHQISDGERRRVQLCMGLMEEWDLLLLDEVTVDLDVQVRSDLLSFLAEETEQRNATIIYATHIFDGLQGFPTHLVHMRVGTTVTPDALTWPPIPSEAHLIPTLPQPPANAAVDGAGPYGDDFSPLLHIALQWLREDRTYRIEKEKELGRQRGARSGKETTDSEKFFSKYDYSQTVTR